MIVKIFILVSSVISHANDQDLLWKARGLQAMEKIDELDKKIKKASGKEKQKLLCQMQVEMVYAFFADSASSKIVSKDELHHTAKFLVFKGESGDMTQIALMYMKEAQKLPVLKVSGLAKDWQVIAIPKSSNFYILGDNCTFSLNVDTPFKMSSSLIQDSKTK